MELISIRNSKHAISGLNDMMDFMANYINLDSSNILEIGSYTGDSTEQFSKRFNMVYSVDPYQNGYDDNDAASYKHDMKVIEANFNERMYKYKNCVQFKMKSSEFINKITGKFDVIYIDGLHTYQGVRDDIKLFKNKVNYFLCGHDYCNKFQGVKDAVDELGIVETFKDTSWVFKC